MDELRRPQKMMAMNFVSPLTVLCGGLQRASEWMVDISDIEFGCSEKE